MISEKLFIDILFVSITGLSVILLIISMIGISGIASFLRKNVVKLYNSISWVFAFTCFLAALFLWLFNYRIATYIIGVAVCTLIVLSLLNIIDRFDIVLDFVYSDFFGFFIFLYLGATIGLGIYFYLIDWMVPAFILPSTALFYFGTIEIINRKIILRDLNIDNQKNKTKREEDEIGPDEVEEKPGQNN
jgi:hypothetical protein